MARTKKKELPSADTESTTAELDTSFNPDEFDPAFKTDEIVHGVAESMRMPDIEQPTGGFAAKHAPATNGHAVAKKQYAQAPDPFGIEGVAGDGNRVQLMKEEPNRNRNFPGAWVIRFEKNPNDMLDEDGVKYSKERPHPVLKALKDDGFRWGFADGDGKGGWGKQWQEGHFTYAEHVEARKTLAKAAEMIGAKVEQGAGIPD